MAEKYSHMGPVPVLHRRDEESAVYLQSEELRRQKRRMMYKYIGIFLVVHIIVITIIALTVMKVNSLKVNVQSLNSDPTTPSFDTSFTTQVCVKNTNWGSCKFDAGTVTFLHQGVTIGQVSIPKGQAGMRSTKKVSVTVSLNSHGSSNLGSELKSGMLTLSSQAKLSGKVKLFLIMKKKKSATMNCTVTIDLSTKTVKTLKCK
ncbi:late embryogenesis abundant protein At1g64065-like [Pyrus communis]|uniref:late embryogenesis abundant protein At1g64065-like n=1 Tax=Pyrus communis TaxID=23211 RepID=UPI0035BF4760